MSSSHAVVIGGGIMGGDIAIVLAAKGWSVHVMSPSEKTRNALPARIAAGLAKVGVASSNLVSRSSLMFGIFILI